jgi:tRNA threonylcarbamoyladenosine biosynthesis protein TsaB
MAAAALSEKPEAMLGVAAADAKRGEIYLSARRGEGQVLGPSLVPLHGAPAMLAPLSEKNGHAVCAGTATPLLLPLLPGKLADSGIRQPHARFVALLSRYAPAGPPPQPLYLRAPDARLPGSP